jgi:putative MATE family efflux protein
MGHETDLTKGSVARQLFSYSMPMILASLLQSLYAMADMAVAGRFSGSTALSAISNGGQLMTMVMYVAVGLSTGGNVLTAQYFGNCDRKNFKEAAGTTIFLTTGTGIALGLLLAVLAPYIVAALNAPALEETCIYIRICAAGCTFIFGYNGLSAVVRAAGDSKKPLQFVAAAAGINVVLDLILMGYFKMGVAGAAIATAASQMISFVLAFIHLMRSSETFGFSLKTPQFSGQKCITILKLGIPIVLQFFVAGLSFLVITFLLNGYGVVVSAGSGIAVKIKDFSQLFIVAMQNSISTMIAQCLGARLFDRVREVLYTGLKLNVLIAAVLILLIEVFAPYLTYLFTDDAEVMAAAVYNIRIEIVGQLFYAVFTAYQALAVGAGNTVFVMLNTIFGMVAARVVISVILNSVIGLPGVYLGCLIAPVAAIPLSMHYFYSGRWKHSMVSATSS